MQSTPKIKKLLYEITLLLELLVDDVGTAVNELKQVAQKLEAELNKMETENPTPKPKPEKGTPQ